MASDITLNDDGTVTVVANALQIDGGRAARAPGDEGTPRHALTHGPGDALIVNDGGDYRGGVKLYGPAQVVDGLLVQEGLDVVGGLTLVIRTHKPRIGGVAASTVARPGSVDLAGVFGGATMSSASLPGAIPSLARSTFEPLADLDPEKVDLVQEVRNLRRAVGALHRAVAYLLEASGR